jgi:DNA/RNA endonuclease G (NUC1)
MLTADPTSGTVSILNANDAKQIVDTVGSANLLLARIPLGAGTNPRYIASTSDRAYIPLETSNEIAVIDPVGLRVLDANPNTPEIDRIHLNVAGNAQPSFIVIGEFERYAYVSDRNSGSIYVIDIDPSSSTYNKHVKTIAIPGTTGIKKLAVNHNGKYLFATTTTNTVGAAAIAVINIDLSSNQVHKWVRNIITDEGIEGITATDQDNVMLFTNRNDARGFGQLILNYGGNGSITSNLDLDRNNPSTYAAMNLGSIYDYFDVNDARDVVWLRDWKTADEYAFVAGFNGRYFGSGVASIDGPKAGSNVGIIRMRPGQKPELVGATKPIPDGLTSSLALSKDNKYLYATNPGAGSTFVFDVEQIVRTVEKRGVTIPISDFNTRPIDEINTSIDIATNVFDKNSIFSNYDKVRPIGTGLSWKLASVYKQPTVVSVDPSITPIVGASGEQQKISFNWELFDSSLDINLMTNLGNILSNVSGVSPANALVPPGTATSFVPTGRFIEPKFAPQVRVGTKAQYSISKESLLRTREQIAISKSLNKIYGQQYKQQILDASVTYNWDRELNTTPGVYEVYAPAPDVLAQKRLRTRTDIYGIKLYVSVFPNQDGLVPLDWTPDPAPEGVDYNPNRILSATWTPTLGANAGGMGTWTWKDNQGTEYHQSGYSYEITLPQDRILTAGQKYYFTVEIQKSDGSRISSQTGVTSYFLVNPAQLPTTTTNTFSEVTLMYHGRELNGDFKDFGYQGISEIARSIGETGGTILRYSSIYHRWEMVDLYATPGVTDYTGLVSHPLTAAQIQQIPKNQQLVLLFSPVKEDQALNSGFAEADADAFYAALVELDGILGGTVGGYDAQGKLERTQGALFNSALHFIGFGRGNIVDSEVVQRLGTYYPIAGGISKESRNLQLTSIDAPIGNGVGILDPEYTIWNNVTYADNYYQTLESSIAAHGKEIEQADWNVDLSSLAGFEEAGDKLWNPHLKTLAWYLGTTNVSLGTINRYSGTNYSIDNPFGSPGMSSELINRRLGDLYTNGVKVYENAQTWYTPDHTWSTSERGDANSVWEGIGTGWFNSIAGGGSGIRPYGTLANKVGVSGLATDYLKTHRIDVGVDNTSTSRQRGDFAVPTLFDGNFDAVTTNNFGAQLIPGWNDVKQENLVDAYGITSLNSHWNKLSADKTQPNYALLLNPAHKIVEHDPFIVPDWGVLRLDLYAPSLLGGDLKVSIKGDATGYESFTQLQNINLTPATGKGVEYASDLYKIGYGSSGFETFTINLPSSLRGKVAELKFELEGSETLYLDNVFFKSDNLKFGNPTQARSSESTVFNPNNLLLEKPQYSVSYNETTKTPNWVSWELNKSWLGTAPRYNYFLIDPTLPNGVTKIKTQDYKNSGYDRGHMLPSGQRTRTRKDNAATFLMTNILPQAVDNNQFFTPYPTPNPALRSAWYNFETYTRDLAYDGKELYLVAGGYDFKSNVLQQSVSIADPAQAIKRGGLTTPSVLTSKGIQIPSWTWKTAVVLDRPGQGLEDVSAATPVYAILTPNIPEPTLAEFQNGVQNPLDTIAPLSSARPLITTQAQWRNWETWRVTVDQLEALLQTTPGLSNFDLMPDVRQNIQNAIESALSPVVTVPNFPPEADDSDSSVEGESNGEEPPSSPLLAAENGNLNTSIFNGMGSLQESSIWESGVAKEGTFVPSSSIVGSSHIGSSQVNPSHVGSTEVGFHQLSTDQLGSFKSSTTQVSTSETGSSQVSERKITSNQFSPTESAGTHIVGTEISAAEIAIRKVDSSNGLSDGIVLFPTSSSTQVGISKFDSKEIFLSSGIASEKFISGYLDHNSSPNLLTNIYSTAQSIWHSNTNLNLNFEITNLPTGQLAEATITGYDQLGRPNAATISIDDDANGVGWFIDITPGDSSEFTGTDTYFQATPNSPASGKYDLLTAILHEMGHTLGFINGYSQFNQNIKGRQFYTDPTHSYTLSSDLSHLDNTLYPNDLLNTNLKPGIRKLPSTMDWAIINAISGNSGVGVLGSTGVTNPAHLTAGALIGITNGDFTTPTTWNTTGATNIINGSATLTEQSQKLSELTQAFIIPTGAKTLQFTIKDNHLITGDTTKTANDAFEVALLDTNTYNPLAGTSIGLTNTDSLLNIQANGTIHKSDKVTITALTNNSSIVTIDLTQVTPTTQATLYFNLLGFGARTSTVTIDDVKLFTDTQPIPVTKNDTLTTNQNTPLTLDPTQLTTNDTNVSQIQIINQPTHGTLTQTPDGKFTYQPVSTYVGNDSFTYLGFGSDGQISNLATVNLTINNLPPTIETLTIPTTIAEEQNIQLSALAKDGGSSDNLTYSWNLGDGSTPITGQNIAHTYTDNGNYAVTLTVTDKDGGTTQQSTQIKVDNVAPTAIITTPNTTIYQGQMGVFSLEGIEQLQPDSEEYLQMAIERTISNSNLGYLAIDDTIQTGSHNIGSQKLPLLGIKSFNFKPGTKSCFYLLSSRCE